MMAEELGAVVVFVGSLVSPPAHTPFYVSTLAQGH